MSAWGTKLRDLPRAGAAWLGQLPLRRTLREETGRPDSDRNERALEYSFALCALGEVDGREVLDVGTGRSAWPHLLATCGFIVRAVDDYGSYWGRPLVNRHYIAQIYSRQELGRWMAENCARLVREELYDVFTGELWTQGERLPSPRRASPGEPHHLACVVLEAPSA